jgi:hypothetical protein
MSPFISDLDGDGHEDILGLIRLYEDHNRVLLAAISGAEWQLRWETELVDANDHRGPELHYGSGSPLAYVVMGASVQAFRIADGTIAWEQQFRAPVESVVHDGAQLRVALDGPGDVLLDLVTGSETGEAPEGSQSPIVLRGDRSLGVGSERVGPAWDAFPGLRVVASYCLVEGGKNLPELGTPLATPCSATYGLASPRPRSPGPCARTGERVSSRARRPWRRAATLRRGRTPTAASFVRPPISRRSGACRSTATTATTAMTAMTANRATRVGAAMRGPLASPPPPPPVSTS